MGVYECKGVQSYYLRISLKKITTQADRAEWGCVNVSGSDTVFITNEKC